MLLDEALQWARACASMQGTSLECIPEDRNLAVIIEGFDSLTSKLAEERQRANDYLEQIRQAHARTSSAEAEVKRLRVAVDEADNAIGEALGDWDGVNLEEMVYFGAPESLLPAFRARRLLRSARAELASEKVGL